MRQYLGCFLVVFLPFFTIFLNVFFVLFYILFGWFYIPYLLWFIIFDRNTPETGGRNKINLRVLKWFQSYLQGNIIYKEKLDFSKNTYLFGIHPHGVISMVSWANILTETDIKIATLKSNFYVPIFRELCLFMGFISANKKSIIHCLKQGKSAGIVVGGAEESLTINQGIILDKRKGFIEIALRTGCPLVPIYNFGEKKLYSTYEGNITIQRWLKYIFGCTVPIVFNLFPKSVPTLTVVGSPIIPKKLENPSKEDIDELHKEYRKALLELHQQYRCMGGEEFEPLKIIY